MPRYDLPMEKGDRILAGMQLPHGDVRSLHQDVRDSMRRGDARFEEIVRQADEDREGFRRIVVLAAKRAGSVDAALRYHARLLLEIREGQRGQTRVLRTVARGVQGMGRTLHAIERQLRIGGNGRANGSGNGRRKPG